jgi:hypothetical protein
MIPNFQERMAKAAQVLSNLSKNFFDFFDFAVKKFCGSSLAQAAGYGPFATNQLSNWFFKPGSLCFSSSSVKLRALRG